MELVEDALARRNENAICMGNQSVYVHANNGDNRSSYPKTKGCAFSDLMGGRNGQIKRACIYPTRSNNY